MRMLQLGRRPGLTQKLFGLPLAEAIVVGNLHRHGAIQLRIVRPPDRTEGPCSQEVNQLELTDRPGFGRLEAECLIAQQIEQAAAGWAVDVGERTLVDNL